MSNTYLCFAISLLFLSLSCTNKKVQLPIIEAKGIHKIQNHSSIWIFFEIENQDTVAVLNKNNKLLNTHWIYNIDKRLPMYKIIPLLEKMQENRNKDSMHKKEGMLNYFSYADVATNNISLIKYNPTKYISTVKDYEILKAQLLNNRIIELDISTKIYNLNRFDFKANDSLPNPIVILNYHKNTSYQNYLANKTLLTKIGIEVCDTEFIFNIK